LRLTPELELGYFYAEIKILVFSYTILDIRIENE